MTLILVIFFLVLYDPIDEIFKSLTFPKSDTKLHNLLSSQAHIYLYVLFNRIQRNAFFIQTKFSTYSKKDSL